MFNQFHLALSGSEWRSAGRYIELYAGGAGAALSLMMNGIFESIHINDYDYHIYCMWYSILNDSDRFCELIEAASLDVPEWNRQRNIYAGLHDSDMLAIGFATFYLNRTNRSGIIYKAGPIGGKTQTGNYGIGVRFNKVDLIKRVKAIAAHRNQITLTNLDAIQIILQVNADPLHFANAFIYLDPPYYNKGRFLYLNNYDHQNHQSLATALTQLAGPRWLLSYDNVPAIRQMYQGFRMSTFDLNYTLQSKKFGSELLIFSDDLTVGNRLIVKSKETELVLE